MYPTRNNQGGHQRFSWQPVSQGDARVVEAGQQQRVPSLPQQSAIPEEQPTQKHFSYVQTPAELRAFDDSAYTSRPDDPAMPLFIPRQLPTPSSTILSQPRTAYLPPLQTQNEFALDSPTDPFSPRISPFSPIGPILQQNVQKTLEDTARNHARQRSNLSPIITNCTKYPLPPMPITIPLAGDQVSPLPSEVPITPMSANSMKKDRSGPISLIDAATYGGEPYSPHGFGSGNPSGLIFSPDALTGPNGFDLALHQPGQITHPNMDSERSPEWKHALCACSDDISTCLTGLICPCVVYGKTSYRLSKKSAKKDPTDMLGYQSANGQCLVMGLSCGLWWLYPVLQRVRIRHMYKLEGNLVSDCAKGLCCCCCVAVQNDREVRTREEANRRWAGPASSEVYTSAHQKMMYMPQR